MLRAAAIACALIACSPAVAQTTTNPARDCAPGTPSGTTDCTKPENKQTEVKPPVPPTNMKDTVIPKSGGTQSPDSTPTTATK